MFNPLFQPEYFTAKEVVPEEIYNKAKELASSLFSDDSDVDDYVNFIVFSLFDYKLLVALDWLREKFGQCIINNWSAGGTNHNRGLRMPSSKYYREGSMHSLHGDRPVKACDCSFRNYTADEVRYKIKQIADRGEYIPFNRIENKVNWIHIDTKETGQDKLVWFNP
jgi:hypothetical protein